MYRMNDKIRSSDLFGPTILELVKLIQAALSLFGMFSLCQDDWNGLLCDLTVDGIQRWVTEIGEEHMGVEVLSLSYHYYLIYLIHTADGESSRSHRSMRTSYTSLQRP